VNAGTHRIPHPALKSLEGVTVSRFFRQAAWEFFQALQRHRNYWTLFCYLLFGSWLDEKTHRLLLCADILSTIEGLDPGNSQAEKFLVRFHNDVLGPVGGEIQWTRPNGEAKKCRQLKKRFFGYEFEEILRREYLHQWDKSGRVYLLDCATYNRSNARQLRREQRKQAGRVPAGCEHAAVIRSYLNSLNSHLFTKKVKENFRSALKATFNLPDGPVKDAQLRILAHINGQPQPFYFPSGQGHTVRLGTSEAIPNLKSTVRRALTIGWEEADLRSSQFVICARLWNDPVMLDFLRTGQPLWTRLFDSVGLKRDDHEVVKPIFKDAIYSICFGMGRRHVKRFMASALVLARLDKRVCFRFMDDPLIEAVFRSRELALNRIKDEGGVMTPYDRWLSVTEERQPRDLMAELAQAWEMKLIYPAFELAQNTKDFTITLYQYDGFSVHFTRRPAQWKQRIEESINLNAQKLGFFTWLEWS
jgi:hypothetical protein